MQKGIPAQFVKQVFQSAAERTKQIFQLPDEDGAPKENTPKDYAAFNASEKLAAELKRERKNQRRLYWRNQREQGSANN